MRVDRFLTRVERTLVTGLARLSEAIELPLQGRLGLDDVDAEVVVDQIDCAGRHGINALWIVRPSLVGAPPEEVAATLAKLAKRHGIDLECRCTNPPEHFFNVVCSGLEACLASAEIARWGRRSQAMGTVIQELEWAASHLENVLLSARPSDVPARDG